MTFKNKYPITKKYLTKGTKRRSGFQIPEVGFIVAHDTGNDGSTALQNIAYYERSNNVMSASAHIFVDDTGIYECIPLLTGEAEKAWHVLYEKPLDNQIFGDDANDIAAGVELCFSHLRGSINNEESYKRYVWVLAYICFKFELDPTKAIIGHHILDPQRKTDPQNALSKMGKSYDQLLQDVVKEYYDCLPKEEIILKLKSWQIKMAHIALDNLNEKGLVSDSEDWKKKVEDKPQEVLNDIPWLFFVMLDRLSNKTLEGGN
ncbi:peptidoglycan recognition protein family protein [Chengkuizengella axinellae]|uniref:N-acetylmuramoyl-L-alanine amidase n=1 Tax=Chengkuizengella axinellae TaxID=3064388 RepID=A0ABT9J1A9_9BACL|nr:peptidoglycan recognition family protein [Chengkuizengella sp. 2205SS18-9]MDP5275263.1 peptidoglycan recognition family protein [Chengkuizengella sp. 2205SS18-9]